MKAMLLTDKKKLEITDMAVPAIGNDDVLIRVKACGICGSDVHGYDGSTGRRIPPVVMGHEASGIIEKAGANVRDFKPGDRVTFDSTIWCGVCHFCREGRINLCDNRRVLGVSTPDYRQHGCFAEFVALPARILYKVPDAVSFEQAAMIEPLSIAIHALSRAPAPLGKSAVVIGAGMIGQLIVQALRTAGVGTLIAVDIDPAKLEIARTAGADHGLNARDPDLVKNIQKLTETRGADLVFEAVGAAPSVHAAIAAARKGATVVLVGNVSPEVPLPLQSVVTREISLLGSCASNGEYPVCLQLIATKKIDLAPLLTATAPLEEGPRWFERLYNKEPQVMKVVINP